jgi:hypothetical protein
VALEALKCGPYTDSEKRHFGAKSTRSLEKVKILALKMAIFQKCDPRADLGWPWLFKVKLSRPGSDRKEKTPYIKFIFICRYIHKSDFEVKFNM